MAKAKITDLLGDLDTAFDASEVTREALAIVHQAAASELSDAQALLESVTAEQKAKAESAIADAQKSFDSVKSGHHAKIAAATEAHAKAQAALEHASQAVSARLGQSDPRVSVR